VGAPTTELWGSGAYQDGRENLGGGHFFLKNPSKLKLEIRPRARGTEVHFPEHTERTDH